MNNEKLIKTLGIVTAIIGIGASLMSSWVGEKIMDTKIEQKVNDILAKK